MKRSKFYWWPYIPIIGVIIMIISSIRILQFKDIPLCADKITHFWLSLVVQLITCMIFSNVMRYYLT